MGRAPVPKQSVTGGQFEERLYTGLKVGLRIQEVLRITEGEQMLLEELAHRTKSSIEIESGHYGFKSRRTYRRSFPSFPLRSLPQPEQRGQS
jgi:hypothetical protein